MNAFASQQVSLSSAKSTFAGGKIVQSSSRAAHGSSRVAPTTVALRKAQAADLRKLSDEDIVESVNNGNVAMLQMRFAKVEGGKDFKVQEYRYEKKKIATLLTIKREREIAQGIGKRESRRISKKESLQY